jgi:hypothetical protein
MGFLFLLLLSGRNPMGVSAQAKRGADELKNTRTAGSCGGLFLNEPNLAYIIYIFTQYIDMHIIYIDR